MTIREELQAEAAKLRASAQKRRDDARANVDSWETALGIARENIRLAQRAYERAEDGLAKARADRAAEIRKAEWDCSEANGLDQAA